MIAATAAALLLVAVAGARADTFVVDNTTDAGAGSLRQAIMDANAATPGPPLHVVDATGVTGEISLPTPLPNLTGTFEIRGPGASALTVRRANTMGLFRIFTVNAGAEIVLSGLTVANGLTPGTDSGGGIHNSGELTVLRSALSGNSGHTGGGIANLAELAVRSSTVSGNTARETSAGGRAGAGIHNHDNGNTTVANSTVSGNTTGGRGAGIYNDSAAGESSTVTITNSTVAANAGAGANLWNDGDTSVITLRSAIVSDPLGDQSNCSGGGGGLAKITSQGYSLADDDSCNLGKPTDQPSTNPMLGPLANNGGPTRTMALPMASPGVDKGIRNGLTTDQRGLTRPVVFPAIPNAPGGDGSDIGAFEVQPSVPPEPPEPPELSNEFSFGKVKKNKRKGTAKLTVNVPGPGELDLTKTKKVKADEERAEAEGSEKLLVKAKGKGRKKLRKRGKVKVKAEVTYTPDGGEPNTQSKRVKLSLAS